MAFAWAKGHGTENDFVLLPDPDGSVHGDLDAELVAGLCHRRRGLGADGVIRVIRTAALAERDASVSGGGEWFMDYRNGDGSVSEMCGNGVRVFALHLQQQGLVEPGRPIVVSTRDGDKIVTVEPTGELSIDMGRAVLGGTSKVSADGGTWEAQEVHTGNPHAVAMVDSLDDAGPLLVEPEFDADVYPEGVNIEFVERRGPRHVAMRVHERGSGETRSCGTGACAVAVVVAVLDGAAHGIDQDGADGGGADGSEHPTTYRVDVPGGTLHVSLTADHHVVLTGPAEVVASGTMEWTA